MRAQEKQTVGSLSISTVSFEFLASDGCVSQKLLTMLEYSCLEKNKRYEERRKRNQERNRCYKEGTKCAQSRSKRYKDEGKCTQRRNKRYEAG